MRDLFDRLRGKGKDEGYAVIDELLKSAAQEGLQLEFKVKSNPSTGVLAPKDRGLLGPALSAFANSAGGVMIWGIEAAPVDGIDAANRPIPIPDLARFQSDVQRAVGDLLMPRHDGIEIAVIEDPKASGTGYLAIWVARSERRPHRSEAKDDKHYWKRIGNQTIRMEHYDIEDAFNRSAPAELQFVVSDILPTADGRRLVFHLKNEDRVSACAPYVWADKVSFGRPLPTGDHMFLTRSAQGPREVFSSGGQVFIHPGQSILAFNFFVPYAKRPDGSTVIDGQQLHDVTVAFEFGFGCMNSRMKAGRFELRGQSLFDFADNNNGGLPLPDLVRRINDHCITLSKPTY
jgi:hypothetical protein